MELGKSCDDTELDARIASLKANQCCTLVYTVSISSSSPPPSDLYAYEFFSPLSTSTVL